MKAKKPILIVEDDIAHRTMLRVLLDRKYAIFEADDGSTAIEEVRSQHLARISHEEYQTKWKNNTILINYTLIYLKFGIADCNSAK